MCLDYCEAEDTFSKPIKMVPDIGYPVLLVKGLIDVWEGVILSANFLSRKIDCIMLPPESQLRKNPLVNGLVPRRSRF